MVSSRMGAFYDIRRRMKEVFKAIPVNGMVVAGFLAACVFLLALYFVAKRLGHTETRNTEIRSGGLRIPGSLSPKDRIAVVSLSWGGLGDPGYRGALDLGTKRLRDLGLEPVFMPNSLKGSLWLGEHPEARAEDLKSAFRDPSIKGIICATGGSDTYRTLPFLCEDAGFIRTVRQRPLVFSGYSDSTVDHLMLYRMGLMSYYGPSFINDIAEPGDGILPYTRAAFRSFYMDSEGEHVIRSSGTWYGKLPEEDVAAAKGLRDARPERYGFESLRGSGTFRGRLLGGCLETLAELAGGGSAEAAVTAQRYGIFPEPTEWEGKIIFLETCMEEEDTEAVGRSLQTLISHGVFSAAAGLIFGKPPEEAGYEAYKELILQLLSDTDFPIMYNVNFGHAWPHAVLPYGALAEVDLDRKEIRFPEAVLK